VVFRVADRFGAPRLYAGGEVAFELTGPGVLVGDNSFSLTESGGAGAIWIKARPESSGRIVVKATHATFGTKQVTIEVRTGILVRRI
jgi:beta-galactosidase